MYLPELDRVFPLHPATRVFACQNPQAEGGDRKGLPRSFLNRFSRVTMVGLTGPDCTLILSSLHPGLPPSLLAQLVQFSEAVAGAAAQGELGRGVGWEFNLRDLLRLCSALQSDQPDLAPARWVELLYAGRMRSREARAVVWRLYQQTLGTNWPREEEEDYHSPAITLDPATLNIGHFSLPRGAATRSGPARQLLRGQASLLESLTGAVGRGWPILLTGPGQCGKTSLVEVLAGFAGATVETISLGPATDTTELLGGWEQCDTGRSVGELWARTQAWLAAVTREQLQHGGIEDGLLFCQRVLQLQQQFSKCKKVADRLKVWK